MQRPDKGPFWPPFHRSQPGFTLVEILVATVLTLIIMAATVTLFGTVTEGIAGSRAIIETGDRLRGTQERLSLDLRGVTAPMLPPLRPEWGLGYFEIREGNGIAGNSQDAYGNTDTTVGDMDDVLMFTCRSTTEPFIGRFGGTTATSQVAEIAWFLRGTTLYRRVLLVLPNATVPTNTGFYDAYDVSVRQIGGTLDPDDMNDGTGGSNQINATLVPNSLADLTKRENRFAHEPKRTGNNYYYFPHGIGGWGQLGLPTLRECSDSGFPLPYFGTTAPSVTVPAAVAQIDYWSNPHPWATVDNLTGTLNAYTGGSRIAEDVILTNVISFDVKVWEPGAPVRAGATAGSVSIPGDADYATAGAVVGFGAYVDLGWNGNTAFTPVNNTDPAALFSDRGSYPGGGAGYAFHNLARTYDTWSTHYESDGVDQDDGGTGLTDEATNGADDDNNGGIDDPGEREAPPPYPYPLRGIQVRIRVFEPDSRQIREVTVVQDFLPE